jgi:hypothetical protein
MAGFLARFRRKKQPPPSAPPGHQPHSPVTPTGLHPPGGVVSRQALFYLNATLSVLDREQVRLATQQVVHGRPARGARFLEIPIFLDREMVHSISMRRALKQDTLRAIQAAARVDAVNAWQQRNAIVYQYQLARMHWKFYRRTDLPSPDGIGLGVGRSLVPFQLSDQNTLVAGETRSGKSVTIESILFAIMQSHPPGEVGLVLVDPNQTFGLRKDGLKLREVGRFTNVAHLLRPVACSDEQIAAAINFVYGEWKKRAGNGIQDAPGIVLVIDELMSEAVIGDKGSNSHRPDHLKKLSQLASQGIKNNIFLVVGAQDPRVSTTSGLFMRNLTQRFIGRVTDGDASRALAGQADVNAHLLTGNGDFVRVGKNNQDGQHLRFQVAEPTQADFNRLERQPVVGTPVGPEEIIDPPPVEPDVSPAWDEADGDLSALNPDLLLASQPDAEPPVDCVDIKTLAIYFYEKRLTIPAARGKYGLIRRLHTLHRDAAAELVDEINWLRAGNPSRSPYYLELRATFYAGIYRLINGGSHRIALAVALPVEMVQDRTEAARAERGLRGWLLGQHSFSVDGVETVVTVDAVRAKVPQPVASWFEWGMDADGQWVKGKAAQIAPTLIIDQGFNTLDVLVVEGGRISERVSEGDTLGMRRAAERLIRTLKHKYSVELELRPAAELVQQAVNGQPALTYVNGRETDVTADAKRAVGSLATDVYNFLDRAVGKQAGAYNILLTGGGALALREKLLQQFPAATVMYEPVLANARGLAKLANRPGFLEG